MRNDTRKKFNHSLAKVAELNGVESAQVQFTVAPAPAQKMEEKIQASSEFLQKINIIPVDAQTGEAIGLSVNSTIAGRTDTTGNGERTPTDPTGLGADKYECKQTNFDVAIPYAKLDAWAPFADFHQRWTNAVAKAIALDRIMIGFNGISAAATTDRSTNAKLQDVNIGWLQKLRANAAARVMKQGAVANKVTYGTHADADYKNLDALVYDAYKSLLDPWFAEDPLLVAIVGRDLMHDKLYPLVADNDAPTERLAADIVISQRRLGGLQAMVAPHFPAGKVLVTRLDNLSIYYQDGARRRAVVDKPEKDRVEFYESSNDAYVIEDYGLCALVENIEVLDAPAP